jgi:site-specific recombinase XerD
VKRKPIDTLPAHSNDPSTPTWASFFAHGFDLSKPVQVRDRALFLLMYRSGLRVGEAVALGHEDIDMSDGRITVPCIDGAKVGARITYFDIEDGELTASLATWEAARTSWGHHSPRYFVSRSGAAVSTRTLRDSIQRYADAAFGSDRTVRLHTHMLRHSFASEVVREGWPVTEVQAALGHISPATTMVYLHADPVHVRGRIRGRAARIDRG